MGNQNGHRYEFGPFKVDETKRLLLRGDEVVSLTPKVFDTLLVLIRNHGEVVDKDTLMGLVWPDTVVEESGLARNISVLRKKLGEGPADHHYIVTVPGRGYRFVAPVSRRVDASELEQAGTHEPFSRRDTENVPGVAAEAAKADAVGGDSPILTREFYQEDASVAPAVSALPSSRSGAWLFIAVLGAIILATASFILTRPNDNAPAPAKILAVLPLMPINNDARDPLFEFAIAESLILKLSSDKNFTVRPLSAVRRFVELDKDPIEAGRELKADLVLSSNYQIVNSRVRVTSQLIDVRTGQALQTFRSDSDSADSFRMQDAVANDIGNAIFKHFGIAQSEYAAKRGTDNEEAYRLYLQGMFIVDIRHTLSDAQKAVEVLERAVELDPDYAQAWAGKAYAHRAVANFIGRNGSVEEDTQKSMEAIKRALSLDENLAEAYSTLCENKMYYEYDFVEAESACKRGIELNPNSPLAHQIYSRYLVSRGRFDEAITEIETTIDLEPASLFNNSLYGINLYYARRYPEAVAQFKRVLAMDENFSNARYWLHVTFVAQGNESEAFELFMKELSFAKADEATVQAFQTAYQSSGWRGVMQEQAKRFEQGEERYFYGAIYNAQAGNKDKAFEYLEKSYQRREMWMAYLQVDPRLDNLRGDPRFAELIGRVESAPAPRIQSD